MGERAHTPGPWERGEWDDCLGYDCMTGGIRVGPVVLDASDYGQRIGKPFSAAGRANIEADADLIAAAPDLLAALKEARGWVELAEDLCRDNSKALALIDAALAKAEWRANLADATPNSPLHGESGR